MSRALHFQWYEEMAQREADGEPLEDYEDWYASYCCEMYDRLKDRDL